MAVKKSVKFLLGGCLRMTGLSILMREAVLKRKNIIIGYHSPDPSRLRAHLNYLVKRYNIISLDTLVEAAKQRDWARLPPKSLVLTFDDGLRGNYELLNVIKEFNVPVSIFLCSQIINTTRRFWFLSGGLSDVQKLKKLRNEERLALLKRRTGFDQEREYGRAQALDLDQINEMVEFVDFQSHSRFHPVLTRCSDQECWEEVHDSKQQLERMLKKEVRHFAYPNGNYGEREIAYLKKSGYRSAVSVNAGWNNPGTDLYCLNRIGICDCASVNELAGQVNGLFWLCRRFQFNMKLRKMYAEACLYYFTLPQ